MDIESTAKRLLGLVEKSGAGQGEIYVESSSGVEMEVRDQAVERLKKKESGGFALRLVVDGKMAVVYSSDLGEASLEKTVAKGIDLAKMAAPDPANTFAEPAEGPTDVGVFDQAFDEIALERKVSLLKDIETLAFAYDPAIRRLEGLSYSDSKAEVVIANTKGVFKRKRATSFEVELSVIAEKDGDVETGGQSVETRFFDRIDPPSEIAGRACWRATSFLGGKAVPSENVPVVLDRDAGWAVLVHFAAMVNGESIAIGTSMLKDRIGQVIASPLVTVVDDAVMPGGIASAPFDDEGTPCARTVVLEGGTLRSFLFDQRTAVKSGAKSTGNGGRDDFRSLPAVAPTNFYLEKGVSTPEGIIKSTARGLFVMALTGWWMGISPSTGDFSSGARGLWIENGEAVFPVKNVTIASNLLDMLRSVDAVGNDLILKHPTAAPTIRIAEMSVGGT